MNEQLESIPLATCIRIKHGYAFASEHFARTGRYKLLTPGNFNEAGGFRDLGSAQKHYTVDPPLEFILNEGDVLIAMTEQSPGLLGATLRVPTGSMYLHNQRLGLVELIRPDLIAKEYVYHLFNAPHVRKEISETASGTKVKHTSPGKLCAISVLLPSLEQQRLVASSFDDWDSAIEKSELLIAAKSNQLSQVRERLIGRIASKHARLRDATRESLARNGSALGRNQIMGITNDRGMRPMREETIATSIDRYKIVRPGAFAYNPMRLNVGSIAMSPFDRDVLVSPDYVVFECDETKLLPAYLNHIRFTNHWISFFDVAGSGSVRIRIYYDDLAAFTFPLPAVEQQRRAIDILDTAVAEIDGLTKYAEALRRQKRGLMQKLLNGHWQAAVAEGVVA